MRARPSGELDGISLELAALTFGLHGGGIDMLTSKDVRRFQQRLNAERDAIESRISANRRGIHETVRDESGVGDREDEADLLYEREAEIDENVRDRKELAQVKRALERIEQGTYGLSEVSG